MPKSIDKENNPLGIREFKVVNYLNSPEMCLYYLLDSENYRELCNHLATVIAAIGRGYTRRDVVDRERLESFARRVDIRDEVRDFDILVIAEVMTYERQTFRDFFGPDRPDTNYTERLKTDEGQALFSKWLDLLDEIGDLFYVDFQKGCLATTMSKVTDQ